MASVRYWMVVTLVSTGLFAGGAFFVAMERVWIWRQLSLVAFADDFRRSIRRADPLQPSLALASAGAGVGLGVTTRDAVAAAWAMAGSALLVLIVLGSVILAEPINSQFRRGGTGDVPPDADRLRTRWRRLHLVRAAVAVVALGCMAAAAAFAR
jgi:hypothetical protein